MKRKLEICCYSIESAIKAEAAGASRIELCDNYSEGGTTPSYAMVKHAINKLKIPVNVIVRPRGGDFLYSSEEFDIIKEDVIQIKKLKANGIVIGFLKANGEIDMAKTREIVELAKPMEVTFHRAFDMCKDPILALEQLIEIGITRILSSGGRNFAMDGIEMLADLVEKSDSKIIVMPGSGVNMDNLYELMKRTKSIEFHCSAKTFEPSQMNYFNRNISMGGVANVDEFKKVSVDMDSIRSMIKTLIRI